MNRRQVLVGCGGIMLAARTQLLHAATADRVVIVGAGIMGASIGYHMAKRGAQVTIVEKERPAAGASQNSFAWLNAGSKRPRPYYELNLLGMLGWRRLDLEIGPELPLQLGGGVDWRQKPDGLDKYLQRIRAQESLGYSIRMIDEAELRRLLPQIEPGPVAYASFADQEGTVDPVGVTKVLLDKAKAFGATVRFPCNVTAVDIASGRARGVMTSQGMIEADHVVLAAGNGTPPLASAAGIEVPLVDSPGVLAHTKPLTRLISRVVMTEGVTLKQNPDGRVVTGKDFEGTPGVTGSREEGESLLATAAKYLPALRSAQLDFVTLGHRVLPKDGHSIIGASPTYSNVYAVATHSGMTLAPIFGQLASLEVLDGVRIDLLEQFRSERFSRTPA